MAGGCTTSCVLWLNFWDYSHGSFGFVVKYTPLNGSRSISWDNVLPWDFDCADFRLWFDGSSFWWRWESWRIFERTVASTAGGRRYPCLATAKSWPTSNFASLASLSASTSFCVAKDLVRPWWWRLISPPACILMQYRSSISYLHTEEVSCLQSLSGTTKKAFMAN